jgi:hypothetical protein
MEHRSGRRTIHLIGRKLPTINPELIASDTSPKIVGQAPPGPRPLSVGSDDQHITERKNRSGRRS